MSFKTGGLQRRDWNIWARRAVSGDPFWGQVVVLLQGGDAVDYSSYGRSIATSGATLNSTLWQPAGLNTVQVVGVIFGTQPRIGWSWVPELEWSTSGWTIEAEIQAVSGNGIEDSHLYTDRTGAGGNPVGWRFPFGIPSAGLHRVYINGSPGAGATLGPAMAYPDAGHYYSLEMTPDGVLHQGIDGVVSAVTYPIPGWPIAFNTSPTYDPTIGMPASVTGNVEFRVGRYRITNGAARYGGMSFTVPSGALPTS